MGIFDYFYVRSLTSGKWETVDLYDHADRKVGEKKLVMATFPGSWCLDNRPVEVVRGLCVSACDPSDVAHFFEPLIDVGKRDAFGKPELQPRATIVRVEPGIPVMFLSESDAKFFVDVGLGERMSDTEVRQMFEQMAIAAKEEADAQAEDGEQGASPDAEPEAAQAPRKRGRARKAA